MPASPRPQWNTGDEPVPDSGIRNQHTACDFLINLIMRIITPSSTLRDWKPHDARSLTKHANNPRIAATMRDAFPSPYSLDDAHRFISMATGHATNLFLAIEIDCEAVGASVFTSWTMSGTDQLRSATGLSESCWGHGIATDAVRSLVPVAFERYDFVRLQAGIFSNNPSSMRVLEKCGFTRDAIHKNATTKNGVLLDEVVYVYFG